MPGRQTPPRHRAGNARRRGGPPLPRLHVVAGDDEIAARDFRARLLSALEAGGSSLAVHLRARRTPARRLHEVAERLVQAAGPHGAHALVNDRLDVALAVGASGVHLREDSIPPADARPLWEARRPRDGREFGGGWVGRSIHSPGQVAEFPAGAVDYFVLGAVYATASHPGRPPLGLDAVAAAADHAPVAVVAIGGITPKRVAPVCAAGAYGVAVASGVWGVRDPAEAVGRYLDAFPDP